MANSAIKYSFYDTQTQTIIENLSWVQAHSLCRCLYKKGFDSFYVHFSNEQKWIPLPMRIEDLLKVTNELLRTIPVPSSQIDDKTIADHQLIHAPVDRREYPRYQKEVELTIDIGGLLKKTKTIDISLSGMKINENLEVRPGTHFALAYVAYKKSFIELKIALILKENTFNTFFIVSCNNLPLWKLIVEE